MIQSVSLTGETTGSLTYDDLSDIIDQLSDVFHVNASDIDTVINYVVTGILNLTIPSDILDNDIIKYLQDSLGTVLKVHPQNIVITINGNKDIIYQVTTASFNVTDSINNETQSEGFISKLNSDLNNTNSEILITNKHSKDEVQIVVVALIDPVDQTQPIIDPITDVQKIVEDLGFLDGTVQSNSYSFLFFFYHIE